jgi:hypothetical protein
MSGSGSHGFQGAQAIDGEPRRRGHQPRLRVAHGVRLSLVPPHVGLLHDVFGVGTRAEHPVGQAEQAVTEGFERSSGSHLAAKTMAASICDSGWGRLCAVELAMIRFAKNRCMTRATAFRDADAQDPSG